MTRTVLLARHGTHAEVGRVLSGRSEIGLGSDGVAEAKRLAARLAGVPLAAVHASPRRRCAETAAIVARPHNLPVTSTPALDEIDFAGWSGRAFADLAGDPAWDAWNARRGSARVPGGEAMAHVLARVRGFLDALDAPAGPVLCVTHGDVIRGLAASLLGLDLDRMLNLDCAPASLTTIEWAGGHGRLVTLNEVPR